MSKDSIYKYPDQDVMNVLLKGMTIFLPREFNTIYTIKSELKDKTHQKYKELIKEDTLLIHYISYQAVAQMGNLSIGKIL